MIKGEISLRITSDADIVTARQKTRWFAEKLGFTGSWPIIASTIISGLARDILSSTKHGRIFIKSIQRDMRSGISINVINDERDPSANQQLLERTHSLEYKKDFQKLIPQQIIDEYNVTQLNNSGIKIKLVKWL